MTCLPILTQSQYVQDYVHALILTKDESPLEKNQSIILPITYLKPNLLWYIQVIWVVNASVLLYTLQQSRDGCIIIYSKAKNNKADNVKAGILIYKMQKYRSVLPCMIYMVDPKMGLTCFKTNVVCKMDIKAIIAHL